MLFNARLKAAGAVIASLLAVSSIASEQRSDKCRCFPGDPCWPSEDAWAGLNASIGGRLIRPQPIGAVCHDPTFDAEACEALRAVWNNPATHFNHPSSVMQTPATNATCNPFDPREQPCLFGPYAQYVVNASSAEDIAKGVLFAKEHNIRLAVKNSGHDYLGKSIGAGSLAIWIHHLNTMSLIDDHTSQRHSAAVRIGAGVLSRDLIPFIAGHGLTAVVGNCPTVGVAGGYIQGGGTSPLASRHGLAADNALAFKVVTAAGEIITADATQNSDLFWALRGGGAGTFGVVVEATVGLFKDVPTVMATLEFSVTNVAGGKDTFWDLVESFVKGVPTITSEASCYVQWMVLGGVFQMAPMVCPDLGATEVEALLKPFVDLLEGSGVQHKKAVTPFPTYSAYYAAMAPLQDEGWAAQTQGDSWFMPKAVVSSTVKRKEYVSAYRKIVEAGGLAVNLNIDVGKQSVQDSAVLPQWRKLQTLVVAGLPLQNTQSLESMSEDLKRITHEMVPLLQAVAPDAGKYLNEASVLDPEWKTNFYGVNYARLSAIKTKYDPDGLFYAPTAVGSEKWTESLDGKLCRAQTERVKDEL